MTRGHDASRTTQFSCCLVLIPVALTLTYCAAGLEATEASFPGRNGVIAFSREGPPLNKKPAREGASTIWIANPRTGRTKQLTHVPRRCSQRGWTWSDSEPSYSASGRLLAYYHEDSCDARTADGLYIMRADGTRRRLIRLMSADENDIPELPALSPSGEFLAFDQLFGSTYVMRAKRGARERDLSDCPGRRCPLSRYSEQVQPAWSPTGRRLALTLSGGEDGTGHIGTVNTRGLGLRLVTRSRRDANPDWSPTGDRIAFHRETFVGQRFEGNIFTAPAHARRARRPKRLTETRDAFFPVWSPNRRYIAYLRDPNAFIGRASLWIMRANDGGGDRLIATDLVTSKINWQPRPRQR